MIKELIHPEMENLQSFKIHEAKTERIEIRNGKSSVVVEDFSIPFLVINRTGRLKISKAIVKLNSTINQLVLIDIFRVLYPTIAEYVFFSSTYKTFTKIGNILGHKNNKFKRIEII